MPKECPKCGQQTLSIHNPFGLETCESCFWVNEVSGSNPVHTVVALAMRWAGVAVIVAGFIFFCAQVVVWGQYSFDATYLIVKRSIGVSDIEDDLELGSICNSINDPLCAVKYFISVVEEQPNHKQALANLGINYAKLSQWEKSKSYFEGYFSLGGNGFDVMLWYGKVLRQLEGTAASLDWSYLALAANPNYEEAAVELVDQLIEENRFLEAYSVIGGSVGGQPPINSHWMMLLNRVYEEAKESGWADGGEAEAVRLPKINGRYFFVPLSFSKAKPAALFAIDKSVKRLWVDEDYVYAHQIDVPINSPLVEIQWEGRSLEAKKITVPSIYIGSWEITDVPVAVCKKCPFILGERALAHFKQKIGSRHQTEFLTIKQR